MRKSHNGQIHDRPFILSDFERVGRRFRTARTASAMSLSICAAGTPTRASSGAPEMEVLSSPSA